MKKCTFHYFCLPVTPAIIIPTIDGCVHEFGNVCFKSIQSPIEFNCFLKDSRPAVTLNWSMRTVKGEDTLPSNSVITTFDNVTYTSSAITKFSFGESSYLCLLVCQTSSLALNTRKGKSILFVDHLVDYTNLEAPVPKYVQIDSLLNLPCVDPGTHLMVWKRSGKRSKTFEILFVGLFGNVTTLESYCQECELNNDGSLAVGGTSVEHEGRYVCIYDDGIKGSLFIYDVSVIGNYMLESQ